MKLRLPCFNHILYLVPLIFFSSCSDNNDDGIPAYITINQIGLTTQAAQGTASHKITDAWVYFGDELIGAFEMPVTFPVLKEGTHEITILPGIKINGIAATRAPYPFYNAISRTIVLTSGQITAVDGLATTYKSNVVFKWMENFDGGSLSVDTTTNSNTGFRRTSNPQLLFDYPGETNAYSAVATLAGDTLLFECATVQQFTLPRNEIPVFIELNYKTNNSITIGVYAHQSSQVSQSSILVLNPSQTWNKVYVNLTPTLMLSTSVTTHKVFIGFLRDSGIEQSQVYFDNIKLLHF